MDPFVLHMILIASVAVGAVFTLVLDLMVRVPYRILLLLALIAGTTDFQIVADSSCWIGACIYGCICMGWTLPQYNLFVGKRLLYITARLFSIWLGLFRNQ